MRSQLVARAVIDVLQERGATVLAVELDDQSRFLAEEVVHEAASRMLPAKLQSIEPPRAQPLP